MKKSVVSLSVAVLTLLAGITLDRLLRFESQPRAQSEVKETVPYCPLPNDLQEVLNVELCQLMAVPERYDGRLVRFNAVMLAEPGYDQLYDHVYLGDAFCGDYRLWVNDQFHLTSRTCPAVMQALDELLMRSEPSRPSKNAKVTVVGRFTSSKYYGDKDGHERWESERFTVIAIERAASIHEDE